MHAETKAELLALKSEIQAQALALKSEVRKIKAEAQEESLALKSETQALKSETQALKTEMRQMKASMGSEIASVKMALMHGKNKTWSANHKTLFWMFGHWCQFRVSCCRAIGPYFNFVFCCVALTSR